VAAITTANLYNQFSGHVITFVRKLTRVNYFNCIGTSLPLHSHFYSRTAKFKYMVANLNAVYPTLHGGSTWASYSRHNPQFIASYPASCRLISSYWRAGESLVMRLNHTPIATIKEAWHGWHQDGRSTIHDSYLHTPSISADTKILPKNAFRNTHLHIHTTGKRLKTYAFRLLKEWSTSLGISWCTEILQPETACMFPHSDLRF